MITCVRRRGAPMRTPPEKQLNVYNSDYLPKIVSAPLPPPPEDCGTGLLAAVAMANLHLAKFCGSISQKSHSLVLRKNFNHNRLRTSKTLHLITASTCTILSTTYIVRHYQKLNVSHPTPKNFQLRP